MYFTDRLMLRQIDPEADTRIMLQWMNDPNMALTPPGPMLPSSRQKVKTSMEKLADKEDKLPCLIICERPIENGPILGVDDDYFLTDDKRARFPAIGLLQVSNSRGYTHYNRCVTLGIALDMKHRGNGLGTEVLRWAVRYCFEDLNMHRIELGTGSDNERALHIYEKKLGFVREGLRRKNAWRNGQWRDTIDLAMLEEEWFEMQASNERKVE